MSLALNSTNRFFLKITFAALSLLITVFSVPVRAQMPAGAAAAFPSNPSPHPYHHDGASGNRNVMMWMDYVRLDGANNGYLWNFNNDYDSADIGISYAAVAFDILAGYTNYANPGASAVDYSDFGFADPYPATLVLTIDSIWILASHENNSGLFDKLIVQIIELDAQGELNGPVLWSHTDSVNLGISPTNEYLEPNSWFYLGYAPGFVTAPGQRLGVRFQYINPNKSDSLAIYGGVRQVPGIGGITQPSAYPNSFATFLYFWPGINRNAQLIYPTNGQYFLAQNWGIWLRVVVDAVLPVPYEKTENNPQLFPNPADHFFSLMWNKAAGGDLKVEIFNAAGQKVLNHFFANKNLSSDLVQIDISGLESGAYFVKTSSDHSVMSSKLVVQH
jgi:hypothetical protein